jgi:hypothetical protein
LNGQSKEAIPRQRLKLILHALESSLRAFEKHRQVIFDRQEAKRGHAIAGTEAPLFDVGQ